ncbi:uroporphyrinogen-III synthase [Vibrio sinensis]|uniref:Uroporphyrinogen-III synthase n=1 Tax=Vibrio sinensis TaxID=2302434 RepID=A0A3A6QH14_9VIBR|nr:uroporphyrinogen-III synthase [Vibrio sinensis]RJX65299.1 uroporphyrinogen-III synthase [Vibrio sinensis]
MTVLVTRPGQQGLSLCQQLEKVGVSSIHHPLITFRAGDELPLLPDNINNVDIVIAVSQHAVTFAAQIMNQAEKSWPSTISYLAVGQKTAHVLSKTTQQQVHYPNISDSEHLLNLPPLLDIKNKRVLILRGNGGRELIYDTLSARGANVEYIEAYQRQNRAFNANVHIPRWQEEQVNKLIITSSGQLNHFIEMMNSTQLNWVFKLTLYVPSERIAIEAHQLGFVSVVNTGSASNKDLLAILWPNQQDD